MTEAEWLANNSPFRLLGIAYEKASRRKVRLFAVACCRRFLPLATDKLQREAVEVSERFADGLASLHELNTGRRARMKSGISEVLIHAASMMEWHAAEWAVRGAQLATNPEAEEAMQSAICRDIFGNPFRPVTLDPSWRTSTVVALAEGIYADRGFDRLPILADALEDAGCEHPEILAHCRSDGPHVRGCWVVDLILGKS